MQTTPQSPIESSTESNTQNTHNSDSGTDSELGSLESDKAEDPVLGAEGGLKLPKSDTESSLPSRIENLNSGSEKETKPQLQKELLPPAKPLPLLKKGKPKGPNGQRPPSRHDKLFKTTEDHAQKEEPPLDVKKAQDKIKQEPTPSVIPLNTRIQKEQEKVTASRAGMTLLRQEEEPAPAVIPEPDAEKVPEQDIKKPIPAVIPAPDTVIHEKENQIPQCQALE